MTVPPLDDLPRARALGGGRLARDLFAVLLVLAGLAGLAIASWQYDPLAFAALLSAVSLVVGLMLAADR